jgi:hypothetical protein
MVAHVQADELRIKQQGAVIWGAMALAVRSRLWLGAVLRPSRDGTLAIALAQLVQRCVQPGRLVWSVDGWKPYERAILQV